MVKILTMASNSSSRRLVMLLLLAASSSPFSSSSSSTKYYYYAAATDPDCMAPPPVPEDASPAIIAAAAASAKKVPHTGYSPKIGMACKQYVYCKDGTISSWHTCPGGLLFNGKAGEDGVCDWAASVTCEDDGEEEDDEEEGGYDDGADMMIQALTPLYGSANNNNANNAEADSNSNHDPDCVDANGTPHTGNMVKLKSGCKQFVSCTDGTISGWHICSWGLMYKDGVCMREDDVECEDDVEAGAGDGAGDSANDADDAANLLVAMASSNYDPDCVAPETGLPYTGNALKLESGCKQYVYCLEGAISSWHVCSWGLMFNEGVCMREEDVDCEAEEEYATAGAGANDAIGAGAGGEIQMEMGTLSLDGVEVGGRTETEPTATQAAATESEEEGDEIDDCLDADGGPVTGNALRLGTDCRQYVYCADGVAATWQTCPGSLFYNATAGVCVFEDAANGGVCDDDTPSGREFEGLAGVVGAEGDSAEPAATQPTSKTEDGAGTEAQAQDPSSSPYDLDCLDADGRPVTGNALKLGTNCKQYVYCMGGAMFTWQTCTGSLFYNATAGVCVFEDEANGNVCDDETPPGQEFEGLAGVVGAAADDDDADGAAAVPPPADTTTAAPPAVAADASHDPDCVSNGMAVTGYAPKSGSGCKQYVYCSTGNVASWNTCPEGLVYDADEGVCVFEDADGGGFACDDEEAVTEEGGFQGSGGVVVGGKPDAVVGPHGPGDADHEPSVTQEQFDGILGEKPIEVEEFLGTTQDVPAPTPVTANSPALPPWTNAPFAPSPTNTGKTVIGYYASWQWYDREKYADPVNVDWSKYDRINYAFFQPDPEGYIYGTDEWADPQLLWGPLLAVQDGTQGAYKCSWDGPDYKVCRHYDTTGGILGRAKAANVEVMPSIGGWTLSDNFPGIAASASRRQKFAQQCVELIEYFGFDGIDIDWEYPGYADHSGTPEDTVNFTRLLQTVRQKLDALEAQTGKTYGLTAALPCGPDKIEKIEVERITGILTELNLMTYDMHGAWDPLSGTNAPMFDQGWGDKTKRWSVHGCVNNYVERGVPLSKMNIGLPFYGRSVRSATGMKQFHGGADDVNFHLDEGSPQYFNIVNQLKGMQTYRHNNTQTQYAVFDDADGGLVSYDDPRAICDKVHYANERGMNGFLIWEISGDMIESNGQMITPLIDATNAKIEDPNYDCSRLRDPLWALKDPIYKYAPAEPAYVDWSQYTDAENTGSENDFSGAQEARPLLASDTTYDNPKNSVYQPSNGGAATPGAGKVMASAGIGNSKGGGCPQDEDGYFPTAGCSGYMYCKGGAVVGAAQACVPGTMFDKSITACAYSLGVQCN